MLFAYVISILISGSDNPDQFKNLSGRITNLYSSGNTSAILALSDSLKDALRFHRYDSTAIAEIYYYSGVCNMFAEKYDRALVDLNQCINVKKQTRNLDEKYGKALFNAAGASYSIGDFIQSAGFIKDYVDIASVRYGENSQEVVEAYSLLAGTSIECIDYESFVDYSFKALKIIDLITNELPAYVLSNLYNTIGVGYARMADFAKARIYLEKSELLAIENSLQHDANYINLINSLAFTYGALGLNEKESEYFIKGIEMAVNSNSILAFNLINSYAIDHAEAGNVAKGATLLLEVVKKADKVYEKDSRFYAEVLKNYAKYLVTYDYETSKAFNIFKTLLDYVAHHEKDSGMKLEVLLNYASLLQKNGESRSALVIVRDLLYLTTKFIPEDLYSNPDLNSIPADKSTLKILQLKYEIIRSMYSESGEIEILIAAAGTSDLIISLIETIRLNISEEESRLVLGSNYQNTYMLALRDFEQCYIKTGERRFLEKAFGLAERSKVAGLLAATRQMKAVEFHIPEPLADREKALQHEISFLNSRISSENEKESPDSALLELWKENLLVAVAARDSLVLTFEHDYPDYFTLKYKTQVPLMNEIPEITGRNSNYINYVISDSVLYIFLINRKYQELLSFKTDSLFLKNLGDFRELLSGPSQSESARTKFNKYQQIGNELYRTLIEPLKKYLISENLIISPDNILSYLPFETFLSGIYTGNEILYRKLDYLMNDYNISYVYSATFMKESVNWHLSKRNTLIAFAPSYPAGLNIDSLINERQTGNIFKELPFALQEAEYVADIRGGQHYMNHEASETVYKTEAAKYSIIHLAMHTVVNDQNPMNSALVFAQVKDSLNDGMLYTYEVYGIPLKAKMVVLSSCNTGSGTLSSGEGILSLARGFLYSGSQSVVMSLWKIEDRSGTDIIKMFYDNLEKGMSKSRALKKARYGYLRKASQLRSHPYFWSTLVVIGDNTPVFFPWKILAFCCILSVIVSLALFFYFRKRMYS